MVRVAIRRPEGVGAETERHLGQRVETAIGERSSVWAVARTTVQHKPWCNNHDTDRMRRGAFVRQLGRRRRVTGRNSVGTSSDNRGTAFL